jgi:hypothetical protein
MNSATLQQFDLISYFKHDVEWIRDKENLKLPHGDMVYMINFAHATTMSKARRIRGSLEFGRYVFKYANDKSKVCLFVCFVLFFLVVNLVCVDFDINPSHVIFDI